MITLEMVEKIREKANVSYEEAKVALEISQGDILDALVYLEKEGKAATPPGGGQYTSYTYKESTNANEHLAGGGKSAHSFSSKFKNFLHWCGKMINKGNNNFLDVIKDGQTMITLPLTALVLLVIFAFWLIIPLVIISLFFGYHYKFRGNELGSDEVNRVMNKASQTAENIKNEVKQGIGNNE